MSNMHYCRFRNTLSDLRDVYNDFDAESYDEAYARVRLLELCKKIVDSHYEYLENYKEETEDLKKRERDVTC